MTQRKSFRIDAAFACVLTIGLAAGNLACAQGTASQPALDSDPSAETDSNAQSRKPADAVVIHEGGGPIDCAGLLAQENAAGSNTSSGNVSRADSAGAASPAIGTSPHRGDEPGQDTQVSTLEECRAQQDAAPDQQPDGADPE